MKDYQERFIDFLIGAGVLTFGDFTTKSGRKTPYFINTGNFNSGATLSKVGGFYAKHIVSLGLSSVDVVFGPAYKGIPLAVATGIALETEHGISRGVSFDRKEAKAHGDKGVIVGTKLEAGQNVLLVEDVVTAGTTLKEMVPRLRSEFSVEVAGVIIAVDRAEKGSGDESAVAEMMRTLSIRIEPIVSVHDIIAYLEAGKGESAGVSADIVPAMYAYLEKYGA